MDEPPYERIFFTGRRRLRDASLMLTGRAGDVYGTSLLTSRRRRLMGRRRLGEPPYGPERRRLRDEPRVLTGRLITGGAYGTSFYGTTLLPGRRRRRLRD